VLSAFVSDRIVRRSAAGAMEPTSPIDFSRRTSSGSGSGYNVARPPTEPRKPQAALSRALSTGSADSVEVAAAEGGAPAQGSTHSRRRQRRHRGSGGVADAAAEGIRRSRYQQPVQEGEGADAELEGAGDMGDEASTKAMDSFYTCQDFGPEETKGAATPVGASFAAKLAAANEAAFSAATSVMAMASESCSPVADKARALGQRVVAAPLSWAGRLRAAVEGGIDTIGVAARARAQAAYDKTPESTKERISFFVEFAKVRSAILQDRVGEAVEAVRSKAAAAVERKEAAVASVRCRVSSAVASTGSAIAARVPAPVAWRTAKLKASGEAALARAQAKTSELAANPDVRFAAKSGAGGAAVLGTSGGAVGLTAGSAIGALVGFVPALFTFGLSIPIGAAIGGGAGLCIGTTLGSAVGFVGGSAVGSAYSRRTEIAEKVAAALPERAHARLGGR